MDERPWVIDGVEFAVRIHPPQPDYLVPEAWVPRKPPQRSGAAQDEALVLSLCSVYLALGRNLEGSPWQPSKPGASSLMPLTEAIAYCQTRGVSVKVSVDNQQLRK